MKAWENNFGRVAVLLEVQEALTQLLLHAGKTLLAKAVANQTSATFLRVVGSELIQKYLGDGPKLVRELFRVAEEHAPSIVFIDEIDAIGTKRYLKLFRKRRERARQQTVEASQMVFGCEREDEV